VTYDWQARITVAGIDWTSPGCSSKAEAEALAAQARSKDDVESAEVERR
jgi:hypothetical protein